MDVSGRLSPSIRLHAIISGRVQGVSFRAYAQLRATELGLTGWVRNLPDGSVETVAEGERTALLDFLRLLEHGPSLAYVDSVDSEWQPPSGEFKSFSVRYT